MSLPFCQKGLLSADEKGSGSAFGGFALLNSFADPSLRQCLVQILYSNSRHKGILSILQGRPSPFYNPSSPISPPDPISPAVFFCIRPIYCLLTVFHAAMYFSIHVVKHFPSRDDSEEPGVGMHFSKQWLFIF